MKSQILFTRKNVKNIISLLSAQFAHSMVSVKLNFQTCGPEVIKFFSCSTQHGIKLVLLINLKFLIITNSFLLNIAEQEHFSANEYENAKYCWHFRYPDNIPSRQNPLCSFLHRWTKSPSCFLQSGHNPL